MIELNLKDALDVSKVPGKDRALVLVFEELFSLQEKVELYVPTVGYNSEPKVVIHLVKGGFAARDEYKNPLTADQIYPDLASLINRGLPKVYSSLTNSKSKD